MKDDGSEKIMLTDLNFSYANHVNVIDGWIYFIHYEGAQSNHIHRIRIDGSDLSRVNWFNHDRASSLKVVGGWIYYILRGGGIYKIQTDGRNRTLLSDSDASNLNVAGGWIYYTTEIKQPETVIMNTDGTGQQVIN